MLFKDYFVLIKKYCKKRTSNEDLCRDLFNSVIENADIKDNFYDCDKTVISRILSGDRNIPNVVRDHIYDEEVIEMMADYFSDVIVPQLIENHLNLIHELLELLKKYPNISKVYLTTLKSLAKEKTLGLFLAEIFRFSVIEGTYEVKLPNKAQNDDTVSSLGMNRPRISLNGISEDCELINEFLVEKMSDIINGIKEKYQSEIGLKIEEVSNIKVKSNQFSNELLLIGEKAKISNEVKATINNISNILNIKITDDFYDLGDLEYSFYGMNNLFGNVVLNGGEEEKKKFNLIYKIYDDINDFFKVLKFFDEFEIIEYIRFAITNSGTAFDENVYVDLIFPKGVLLKTKEIVKMDEDVYNFISEGGHDLFTIESTSKYFDYDTSIKKAHYNNFAIPAFNPFGYNDDAKSDVDKENELNDYFNFCLTENKDNDVIVIEFDEIMHNQSIAFPSIILLKKPISSIEYSIRSKHMPNKINGRINICKSK